MKKVVKHENLIKIGDVKSTVPDILKRGKNGSCHVARISTISTSLKKNAARKLSSLYFFLSIGGCIKK